jgi:hypothetical protein
MSANIHCFKIDFFLLFKLSQICKIQIRTFKEYKIHQTMHDGSLNSNEHLWFLKQVQIPNIMWIKILGNKLTLNLGRIYWGFKQLSKNLVNSPKFYLDFIFMNINLFCLVRIPKCGVSKYAPNGLVWNKIKTLNLNFKLIQACIPSIYYRYMVRVQ